MNISTVANCKILLRKSAPFSTKTTNIDIPSATVQFYIRSATNLLVHSSFVVLDDDFDQDFEIWS